jgi:hypothetical protein
MLRLLLTVAAECCLEDDVTYVVVRVVRVVHTIVTMVSGVFHFLDALR